MAGRRVLCPLCSFADGLASDPERNVGDLDDVGGLNCDWLFASINSLISKSMSIDMGTYVSN